MQRGRRGPDEPVSGRSPSPAPQPAQRPADAVRALQRSAGNAAVGRLLRATFRSPWDDELDTLSNKNSPGELKGVKYSESKLSKLSKLSGTGDALSNKNLESTAANKNAPGELKGIKYSESKVSKLGDAPMAEDEALWLKQGSRRPLW